MFEQHDSTVPSGPTWPTQPSGPSAQDASLSSPRTRWRQAHSFWHMASPKLRRRFSAGVAILVVACVGAAVALISAQAKPDGYLWTSAAQVDFIQFTEDQSGHLNGTWQSATATSTETVQMENVAVTGAISSSHISLTASILGISSTVVGTLSGGDLTLNVPDQNGYVATEAFHAASVSDYDGSLAYLRQQTAAYAAATQSAQATATAQATGCVGPVAGQHIYDCAHLLTPDEVTVLEAQAAKVEEAGAPTVVYLQVRDATAQQALQDATDLMNRWNVESYPGAHDGFVMFFDLQPGNIRHGQVALYTGAKHYQHGNLPQAELDRIRTDGMTPLLQNGQTAAGIAAGLQMVAHDLRYGPPLSSASGSSVVPKATLSAWAQWGGIGGPAADRRVTRC